MCACLPRGEMRLVLQLNGLPLVLFCFGFLVCLFLGQCSEVRMRKRKAIYHKLEVDLFSDWVKVGVEGSL